MERNEIHPTGELIHVPRYPRTGTVVSVRLEEPYARILLRTASQQRRTVSDLAREAITRYLDQVRAIPFHRSSVTGTAGFAHQFREATVVATSTEARRIVPSIVIDQSTAAW